VLRIRRPASRAPLKTLEVSLRIPDLWQQQAVAALRAGQDVVVHAPTGAGKTYIFELLYASLKGQAVFTVPTRALANDKFAEWRATGWDVGICTGDVSERPGARVIVATLETQRGNFLRRQGPKLLVIDEYQMLGDPHRGANYELALALAPPQTQLLLLSGSVGNPADVVAWLRRLGRDAVLVATHDRPVPLEEAVLDTLPYRVDARSFSGGYWPRLVAKALLADLGPILLFAPRRQASEDLAQELSNALPVDEPLSLSPEQAMLAGEKLAKMLRRRIAYHHSGLSYAVRAGLIEPLAKAGQLRAVVATTGLAAGVNFSLRSVLITDTRYSVRHFERHLLPEELLQMFGRAGRRGLDDCGYVLVAPGKPRLEDARPKTLRRANQIDWPTLISVMGAAAARGEPPLTAAAELCQRLFSVQNVPLGVERSVADGPRPCGLFVDAERTRLAHPQSVEILNSAGEWEARGEERAVPLQELWIASNENADAAPRWRPAMQSAEFMRAFGRGNLCKLRREDGGWGYGRELPLAAALGENEVRLVKGMREALTALDPVAWEGRNWPPGGRMGRAVFEERVLPLAPALSGGGGALARMVPRGNVLAAQIDFSGTPAPACVDSLGRALHQPPERKNYPACCQTCPQLPVCEHGDPAMTPALAWRKLGLIEPDGTPTRRGTIFGFFHHGEGLAIAAALEQADADYPIDALLYDLANLRAGHRFAAEGDSPYGGKLGNLCQRVYGRADYPGYLEMGVPIDYGDGAAEVVAELERHPADRRRLLNDLLRLGDLERVLTEWRSLLLHVRAAPDYPWDRWRELKAAAGRLVEASGAGLLPTFPPLLPAQQRRYQHRLFLKG
jgi:superfamily II DNA/RNA helicase